MARAESSRRRPRFESQRKSFRQGCTDAKGGHYIFVFTHELYFALTKVEDSREALPSRTRTSCQSTSWAARGKGQRHGNELIEKQHALSSTSPHRSIWLCTST